MTPARKMTFSVPEEIAEKLEGLDNRSAYVSQALQEKLARERHQQMFAERWGRDWEDTSNVTDEARAWAEGL